MAREDFLLIIIRFELSASDPRLVSAPSFDNILLIRLSRFLELKSKGVHDHSRLLQECKLRESLLRELHFWNDECEAAIRAMSSKWGERVSYDGKVQCIKSGYYSLKAPFRC